MKLIEIFADAIPGLIIQFMAIATVKDVRVMPWVFLAVSAFSTGFSSATISYNFDTNPEKRRKTPDFYGFVPAVVSKKAVVFAPMLLISARMPVIRSTTIVAKGKLLVLDAIGRNCRSC